MRANEHSTPCQIPAIDGIERARRTLAGRSRVTPLLSSARLYKQLGLRLLAKAEMLQHTGSYKFRGAAYLLARLAPAFKQRGLVTFSSGNYAHALAAAAREMAARVSIVMPSDAPTVKIESTRFYGVEVILYDRALQSREQVMHRIAAEREIFCSHPHEESALVEGYGTAGLELMEQACALGNPPDAVLVPCSGGCLLAGVGLAARARDATVELFGVEPEGFNDVAVSLLAGRPVALLKQGQSLCDALLARLPGQLPFGILKGLDPKMLTAPDELCLQAMELAFEHLRVVCEPSGVIALAAVLAQRERFAGRTVAVVLSGGNVDASQFGRAIGRTRRVVPVDN